MEWGFQKLCKGSARAVNSAEMRMGADDFVENAARAAEMSVTNRKISRPQSRVLSTLREAKSRQFDF